MLWSCLPVHVLEVDDPTTKDVEPTALVEAGELMDRALATAAVIARNAPLAVTATRAGIRELIAMDLAHAYQRQEELGRPLRSTEDAKEAQRAFVEKREPIFRGC